MAGGVETPLAPGVIGRDGEAHPPASLGGFRKVPEGDQVLDPEHGAGARQPGGHRPRRRARPLGQGRRVDPVDDVRHQQGSRLVRQAMEGGDERVPFLPSDHLAVRGIGRRPREQQGCPPLPPPVLAESPPNQVGGDPGRVAVRVVDGPVAQRQRHPRPRLLDEILRVVATVPSPHDPGRGVAEAHQVRSGARFRSGDHLAQRRHDPPNVSTLRLRSTVARQNPARRASCAPP